MRTKAALLFLLLIPIFLSGCTIHFGGLTVDDDEILEPLLERVSAAGAIYRPLVDSGDDWIAQPFDRMILLFGTRRDQYGNRVGLSDDDRWTITDVTIRCELKNVDDTVYNPGDPFQRHGFSADGIDNACVWYPLYTGDVDGVSGLTYAPYPEVGYAFHSCGDLCRIDKPIESLLGERYYSNSEGKTTVIVTEQNVWLVRSMISTNCSVKCANYPSQTATITARATTDVVTVQITCPDHGLGTYTLDLPGATPSSSNVIEVSVGHHGEIDVVWQDGDDVEVYTVEVPADWFWISGTWTMTVMATGAM